MRSRSRATGTSGRSTIHMTHSAAFLRCGTWYGSEREPESGDGDIAEHVTTFGERQQQQRRCPELLLAATAAEQGERRERAGDGDRAGRLRDGGQVARGVASD